MRWPESTVVFEQGAVPHVQRDPGGAALLCSVLADDFHLKNLVGVLVGCGFGVSQECYDPVLKGTEAAFDFAFGLGRGRDEVGYAKPAQGTLELAFGIAMVSAGTWAEEAQAVRVDGFRQAVGFKRATEVLEVIPGGLGGNESARDVATGVIIDG